LPSLRVGQGGLWRAGPGEVLGAVDCAIRFNSQSRMQQLQRVCTVRCSAASRDTVLQRAMYSRWQEHMQPWAGLVLPNENDRQKPPAAKGKQGRPVLIAHSVCDPWLGPLTVACCELSRILKGSWGQHANRLPPLEAPGPRIQIGWGNYVTKCWKKRSREVRNSGGGLRSPGAAGPPATLQRGLEYRLPDGRALVGALSRAERGVLVLQDLLQHRREHPLHAFFARC